MVLEVPAGKTLSDQAINNLRNSWLGRHAGLQNAHSVAILEDGLQAKALGQTNDKSQFLEARRHQVAEIVRFFGVPLHMVNEPEKARSTTSNRNRWNTSNTPCCRNAPASSSGVNVQLLDDPDRFYMKHNFDAVLRGII